MCVGGQFWAFYRFDFSVYSWESRSKEWSSRGVATRSVCSGRPLCDSILGGQRRSLYGECWSVRCGRRIRSRRARPCEGARPPTRAAHTVGCRSPPRRTQMAATGASSFVAAAALHHILYYHYLFFLPRIVLPKPLRPHHAQAAPAVGRIAPETPVCDASRGIWNPCWHERLHGARKETERWRAQHPPSILRRRRAPRAPRRASTSCATSASTSRYDPF